MESLTLLFSSGETFANDLETFSESESISRKNLAQSILAKERESELKKDRQVRRTTLSSSLISPFVVVDRDEVGVQREGLGTGTSDLQRGEVECAIVQ